MKQRTFSFKSATMRPMVIYVSWATVDTNKEVRSQILAARKGFLEEVAMSLESPGIYSPHA